MVDFLGKKALVVEDDDDIRGLLEVVLAQMGFEVRAVETARAGIKHAREHSPDLITLDIGLPDMSGLEALKEIRAFHQGDIVMLTARGQKADKTEADGAGATAYLMKPFRPKALREELRAILER